MTDESTARTSPAPALPRRRITAEIVIVLALSLGVSAVYAVIDLVDVSTRATPIGQQSQTLNASASDRSVFDLLYQLLGIAADLAPVALVCYLLWSSGRPHLGRLGLRGDRIARDSGLGVALVVAIGIPGLGIYLAGRALGLTPDVVTNGLDAHWWTIPVLVLSAARSGIEEEVIVVGYLFARLRELGWGRWSIILSAAVLRGSYHLYQGVPAFIGNLAMGVVFGWLYTRYGRLLPLVVAHTLIDVIAFVGYPLGVALLPQLFGPTR